MATFVVIGHPERHQNDRYVDNDNVAAGYAATKAADQHDVANPYVPAISLKNEEDHAWARNCLVAASPELDWYYDTHRPVNFSRICGRWTGCADDLLFGTEHELRTIC